VTTRLIYVDLNEETYEPFLREKPAEEHLRSAHKFLYWTMPGHEPLCVLGRTLFWNHEMLWRSWQSLERNVHEKEWPVAAGEICGDELLEWRSYGLGIVTPEGLKPTIMAALGLKA
jgi:hypothetical protein